MVDFTDPWPDWGKTGERPPNDQDYAGGDNLKKEVYNYLWYQFRRTLINTADAIEGNRTYADNEVDDHSDSTTGVHGIESGDVASMGDVTAVEDLLSDGGTTYEFQVDGTDDTGVINFKTLDTTPTTYTGGGTAIDVSAYTVIDVTLYGTEGGNGGGNGASITGTLDVSGQETIYLTERTGASGGYREYEKNNGIVASANGGNGGSAAFLTPANSLSNPFAVAGGGGGTGDTYVSIDGDVDGSPSSSDADADDGGGGSASSNGGDANASASIDNASASASGSGGGGASAGSGGSSGNTALDQRGNSTVVIGAGGGGGAGYSSGGGGGGAGAQEDAYRDDFEDKYYYAAAAAGAGGGGGDNYTGDLSSTSVSLGGSSESTVRVDVTPVESAWGITVAGNPLEDITIDGTPVSQVTIDGTAML